MKKTSAVKRDSKKQRRARVLAITNFKGGVAKTTTTSNLAAAAVMSGRRVLIVDFDPQGHAGLHFGIRGSDNKEKSLWRALSKNGDAKSFVVNVAAKKRELGHRLIPAQLENLDLITSSFDLLRHGELKGGSSARFAALVDSLRSDYDLILVESAPSSRDIHKTILAVADEILVPFVPDTLSIQGTVGFLDAIYAPLRDAGQTRSSLVGLLPVMVRTRSVVHGGGMASMRAYAKGRRTRVTSTFIPYSVVNATSMAERFLPVVLGFPKHAMSLAYVSLAEELSLPR